MTDWMRFAARLPAAIAVLAVAFEESAFEAFAVCLAAFLVVAGIVRVSAPVGSGVFLTAIQAVAVAFLDFGIVITITAVATVTIVTVVPAIAVVPAISAIVFVTVVHAIAVTINIAVAVIFVAVINAIAITINIDVAVIFVAVIHAITITINIPLVPAISSVLSLRCGETGEGRSNYET